MKKTLTTLFLLSSSLFAKDILVEDIYVGQTPPNAQTTAIFFTLKNNSNEDIIITGAKSDAATYAELHTHTNDKGKMAMIKLPQLIIPAHSSVKFTPGSNHIMLFGLKEKIDADTRVSLSLILADSTSLDFENISSRPLHKAPHHERPKKPHLDEPHKKHERPKPPHNIPMHGKNDKNPYSDMKGRDDNDFGPRHR